MIIPDFSREEKLFKKGYKIIAGIDEAGRGSLAGPVVAAAVVFSEIKVVEELIKIGIMDSKVLSAKKRDCLYNIAIEKCRDWAIGIVSERTIDKINVLEASKLAMKRAVENLSVKPDFLLIDGKYTIEDYPASQMAIPHADEFVFSVSVASILAKVARDKILTGLDKKYPEYGFAKHKGYGTEYHMKILKKNGHCEIHRKTFKPISVNSS